jgi:hypothetical protein
MEYGVRQRLDAVWKRGGREGILLTKGRVVGVQIALGMSFGQMLIFAK